MESFRELMVRLRAGDAQATRELFDEYHDLLLMVVRRYLSPNLRAQVDSVDFVQEVWLSFLQNPAAKPDFATPQSFGAFLATIARNKVIDGVRRGLLSAGYNATCEVDLPKHPIPGDVAPAHLETPSKSAIRRELKDVLLQGMGPVYQKVGQRILSGIDPPVIAAEYGLSQRTVERIRERIVKQLHSS